ncbi:MAG: hypothetical protein V3576_06765 [Candidatus Cloacimonadota bacterium]
MADFRQANSQSSLIIHTKASQIGSVPDAYNWLVLCRQVIKNWLPR